MTAWGPILTPDWGKSPKIVNLKSSVCIFAQASESPAANVS